MGLETGTGIGDLVPTNPLSTDAVSSGDDHIRLIKTVMQSITFLKNIVTFTANGTWTRPANVKRVLIYCLGGGAGGGGGTVASYSGGGGSGGAMAIKWLDVTAIPSASIVIGAGGAGGAGGVVAALGNAGGDTAFITPGPVTQCLGFHGAPGDSVAAGGNSPALTNSIGDIKFIGGDGAPGRFASLSGETFGGMGGGLGGSNSHAQANTGGGAVGGNSNISSAGIGADGGSGYCVIFEFGW